MPVTSQWLDEPPERPQLPRNIIAGIIAAVLVLLTVRVIAVSVAPMPAPATATPASATAPATAPAQAGPTPAATALPALTSTPTSTPAPAQPTAGDACPDAAEPPSGARIGWLARAAGCPDIALATLNGTRQWVRRAVLPDDLYNQLPEVEP
jgi:hypothetical protein